MKIEIPLEGGFNSQYDSEEVGSGFTELVNLVNTKNGKFVKRPPVGQETELVGVSIADIIQWRSPDDTLYWIVFDKSTYSNAIIKRYSEDFSTYIVIGTVPSLPDRIQIDNNGSFVRFACGHNELPRIYQFIERNFFWGTEDHYTNGLYHFDFATPKDSLSESIIETSLKSIKSTNSPDSFNYRLSEVMFSRSSKTLNTEENIYNYMYSLIFDGDQETLPSSAGIDTSEVSFVDGGIQGEIFFNTGANLSQWNPRVTGINIYRGSDGSVANMRKIITTTTLDTKNESNYIEWNDAHNGGIFYVKGGDYTNNELVGKILPIHHSTVDFSEELTIRGNTKDCIFVDQPASITRRSGAIWNQYVPICSNIQYQDIAHDLGGGYDDWSMNADSVVDNRVGPDVGYYNLLGHNGLSFGSYSNGVLVGESGDSSSETRYIAKIKLDTTDFPDVGDFEDEYKWSIMVGMNLWKLNVFKRVPDAIINVEIWTSSTDPSLVDPSPGDAVKLWAGDKELFSNTIKQYRAGTWEGSTQVSETGDVPPGDGYTIDYLSTSFELAWVNATGTLEILGDTQWFYLYVTYDSAGDTATDMMLALDNFIIAETIDNQRMCGGLDVVVSPTGALDPKDGRKDWAYIGSGTRWDSTDGVTNTIGVHSLLNPLSEIGHIHNNTTKALIVDRYSGNGYISVGDGAEGHQWRIFPLAETGVYTSAFSGKQLTITDNADEFVIGLNASNYGESFIVGNIIHITGTASNNGSFLLTNITAPLDEDKVLTFDHNFTAETVTSEDAMLIPTRRFYLSRDYQWRRSGLLMNFVFWDKGLADGAYHPTATASSLEVGYKYATDLNGRRFVANVNLDPEDTNELHKDWLIFSEIGQPDVLPISNYIDIKDLQGGEIHGIEALLGDVVIFMDNGIFRLSVPSSDPTQWNVAEAIKDIGCSAPDTIVLYDGGVFFAGKDHYYYLNPNFELTPVTNSIKDEYQNFYNTDLVVARENKQDRLLLRKDSLTFYIFDLKSFSVNEENWSKHTLDLETEGMGEFIFNDLNYDLYFSRVLNGNKSYVKSITPPEGTVSVSSVSATLKTGWIPITNNYGRDSIVRRINMRYRSDTSEITVSLYINEDSETKVWEGSLKTFGNMQSLRVGRRAKNIQLVINIKPITPYDLIPSELRRIEIETD